MDDGHAKPKESSVSYKIDNLACDYFAKWNNKEAHVNHYMIFKGTDIHVSLDWILWNFNKYTYLTKEKWIKIMGYMWDLYD